MQVDSHINIFTLNWVSQVIDHVFPHIYDVIVIKQEKSSILFIKCTKEIRIGKSINRDQSGFESSYIDTIDLNFFSNRSIFV